MSTLKQRHTLTLDPDAVRRANALRHDRSLSSFVNEAIVAYTSELEQAIYRATPATTEEQAWTDGAATSFVGDDDDDWDTLFSNSST